MTAHDQRAPSLPATTSSTSSRTLSGEQPASFIRRRVPFLFSVRFGLTAWYAGVLILTLALSGVALRFLLVRSLNEDADARLRSAAERVEREIIRRTVRGPGGAEETTISIEDDVDISRVLLSGMTVTVIAPGEAEPLLSKGAFTGYWPAKEQYGAFLSRDKATFVTATVSGQSMRGLAYPILPDGPEGDREPIGMIFTAESLAGRDRVLESLNRVIMIAGFAGVIVASYGGWLLAGRVLAPVNRIMTSADTIAKGKGAVSLSSRIDVPRTGDEIAQLALTFNDLLDRIEAAFVAQRRFVGDASHELRTPLTSIKGNIDVLRSQIASGRATDPDDLAEALADVHREADRMGRLVDDLLVLARTDAEALGSLVTMDVVSLDVLAQEAARTAEALAHGQEFVLHTPYPVLVHGDGDRLVQVMLILLDNAFRHTPPDGKVTLSISSGTDPQEQIRCGRIDVVDSGKGIAPEHLPHLFERFYRAEGSRSRSDGGTGLGLAIALAIVRSHHGWIDVESAPGQGTRFTVWIPLPTDGDEPAPQSGDRPSTRRMPRVPRIRRNDE